MARVLQFLQHVAHVQPKHSQGRAIAARTDPSRSPFHGLVIAAVLAACFWAVVALVISHMR